MPVFHRHQILNRFHSIAAQLFLFFVIGMIVPVAIGGMISYEKSKKIIEDQVSEVASLTISQVKDKLNLLFRRIDDTSMTLLGNSTIQDVLKGVDSTGTLTESQLNLKARKLLADVMNQELFDIYIFDIRKQNNILTSDYSVVADPWNTEWFKRIKEANGLPVWFGLSNVSYLNTRNVSMGYPVFGLGRAIKDLETGEILAVMLIEVRGDILTAELDSVTFGKTGHTVLVDDRNRYMYHPDPQLYGSVSQYKLPKSEREYQDRDKHVLLLHETLDNGWHVNGIVPVEELVRDSNEIRNLTLWILLGSVLLAIVMGFYVSHKIGRPLVRLSKLMKRGEEGDLTVRTAVTGKNEIGQLGRSFNKMIQKIDELIAQIGEEETQKKKAEIRALRYQINPHFLYNTLNSIRWMAKLNKTEQVVDAISALVQLLDASLQRNGAFVRLGDELNLLKKYMVIQQYRYDSELRLNIRCPSALRDIQIPGMLLQPIVENAIFHGIAPKDGDGAIEVQVIDKGKDIHILIRDDGVGIAEEQLSALLFQTKSEQGTKGMTGIGLAHVHETLQLYYGKAYGVSITSRPGEGTAVHLKLSKQQEGKYVSSVVG